MFKCCVVKCSEIEFMAISLSVMLQWSPGNHNQHWININFDLNKRIKINIVNNLLFIKLKLNYNMIWYKIKGLQLGQRPFIAKTAIKCGPLEYDIYSL